MKMPDAWVYIPRIKNRTTIEIEQKELVTCKNCIYRGTDFCKWRQDETLDDYDFCSVGRHES